MIINIKSSGLRTGDNTHAMAILTRDCFVQCDGRKMHLMNIKHSSKYMEINNIMVNQSPRSPDSVLCYHLSHISVTIAGCSNPTSTGDSRPQSVWIAASVVQTDESSYLKSCSRELPL
jgi:hypothetical protein